MKNVLSEMEETGDRGDSNDDDDSAETLDDVAQESRAEKRQFMDEIGTVAFVNQNVVTLSESKS